ncbi:hypothetical protein P3X46_033513 [Hevea brasiliensis]|uniref:Plastocyanin-like domain-containing protein n=1 Tax=Hevea brasiliensis TaxID=3981 RepID=A0ABQ9KBI8_HEVBR|nr:hypothetical protein P3X46_033513 [Hevea brasiliensis]
MMGATSLQPLVLGVFCYCNFFNVFAEDPYRFFEWNVTYGNIYPLGVKQQGILINGQFPGPDSYSVTNNNLIINVHNSLPEPFLISWNGVQHRRNSYQDGVYGTTCPIPPGKKFTYAMQVKDQIGSFFYFPSLAFHKAAGGFGGTRTLSRSLIPVPFPNPADDFTVLIGDWYSTTHTIITSKFDTKLSITRTNLTASGPRPNPQGSYHYGLINISKTIKLESSAAQVNGKQRYAVNSVSFVPADTPLKLADYFKIVGAFRVGCISDNPIGKKMYLDTSVMGADFKAFVEIVFQNHENIVQSWHLDGYSWVVGALDNVGMWNVRTEFWARQYLGQQFYLRVYSPVESIRDEYPIPKNALLCGRATGKPTRPRQNKLLPIEY